MRADRLAKRLRIPRRNQPSVRGVAVRHGSTSLHEREECRAAVVAIPSPQVKDAGRQRAHCGEPRPESRRPVGRPRVHGDSARFLELSGVAGREVGDDGRRIVARAQGLGHRRTVRISIGEDQDWLGSPRPIDAGVERRWLPGKVIERALAVAWLRADRAKQQAIESCDDRPRRIV